VEYSRATAANVSTWFQDSTSISSRNMSNTLSKAAALEFGDDAKHRRGVFSVTSSQQTDVSSEAPEEDGFESGIGLQSTVI